MVLGLRFLKPKKQMKDGSVVLVVGGRGSGKTTIMLDLCYHKRHIPDGIAFCGTQESNTAFDNVVPDSFIFEEWDPEEVQRVINRQKVANAERKAAGLPKKFTFIIFDDFGHESDVWKDKMLRQIFMNGRWAGIFFIFTLQYMMDLPSALRGNVDWVFVTGEKIPANRKRLYDYFCGGIGTRKEFDQVLNAATDGHYCFVAHTTARSTRPEDCFFYWKAKVRNTDENPRQRKWHMGSKAYWAEHFAQYDKEWATSKTKRGAAVVGRRTKSFVQLLPSR